jgi:hypothetical protein
MKASMLWQGMRRFHWFGHCLYFDLHGRQRQEFSRQNVLRDQVPYSVSRIKRGPPPGVFEVHTNPKGETLKVTWRYEPAVVELLQPSRRRLEAGS